MNTKETQQVMENNETYVSLFEYLGKGSGGTNIGREVTAEAVKQGIDIKWKTLPKEAQKPEYTQVQIYPLAFLDEYFGNMDNANNIDVDRSPLVRRSALIEIQKRFETLEAKFEQLIKKLETNVTNSNEPNDDYDLPF
jgi:hypothetical protein